MSERAQPQDVAGERRLLPNLLLLLATCFTTTWVGVLGAHPDIGYFDFLAMAPHVADGLPHAATLMGILLAHEAGHYLMARWHGVDASLPYFLPVPLPLTGTMGAVIVMRGRITSRNALADWAAAGPLAGLVVALPLLAYGIHLSPVGPSAGAGLQEGNSLLYLGLKLALKGAILPADGLDVQLHPVAWAAWFGVLVTMLNLVPIGQLDGGHIAYAFFGDRYERWSARLHRMLIPLAVGVALVVTLRLASKVGLNGVSLALGIQAGMPWLVWGGLLLLFRRLSGGSCHPPVGEDPLSPGRRRLCVLMMVLFCLIFVPIPLHPLM